MQALESNFQNLENCIGILTRTVPALVSSKLTQLIVTVNVRFDGFLQNPGRQKPLSVTFGRFLPASDCTPGQADCGLIGSTLTRTHFQLVEQCVELLALSYSITAGG